VSTFMKTTVVTGSVLLGATLAAGQASADYRSYRPQKCEGAIWFDTDDISAGGNCDADEVTAELLKGDDDNNLLTVFYEDFVAKLDRKDKKIERKTCDVRLLVKLPDRCKLAIDWADISGEVLLQSKDPRDAHKLFAKAESLFWFPGQSKRNTREVEKVLQGPEGILYPFPDRDEYIGSEDFSRFYSKCGGDVFLAINSTLTVANPWGVRDAVGEITLGAVDAGVESKPAGHYRFRAEKCDDGKPRR